MMMTFPAPPLGLLFQGNAITQLTSTTKQGPSAENWDRVRPIIKRLYIDEDRTLTDLMNIMTLEHGHKATVKMYKLRFTRWGFDKHNRQSDMAFLLRKKTARGAIGKNSNFIVRNRVFSTQEVDRYVQRKGASAPGFKEAPADQPTPKYIVCFTPPASPYPEGDQHTSMVLAVQDSAETDGTFSSIRLGKRRRSRFPGPAASDSLGTQRDYRRIRAWTRSPSLPYVITLSDQLRRPEMLFGDISSYVRGSISNGTWYLDGKGVMWSLQRVTVSPDEFSGLWGQAIKEFKKRASASRGRRLLSKAFSLLPALLREREPAFLETMVDMLLWSSQAGFAEVATMVQNHIAELVRAILPEDHIWRRICIAISYSDPDHPELLTRSWRCLVDVFARVAGKFSKTSVTSEAEHVYSLYRSTDPQRAEKLLRRLLADYEQATGELDNAAMYVVDRLADVTLEQGRHAEVELLVEDTLFRAREAGSLSKFWQAILVKELAWAQYFSSKHDLAEKSMRSAMAFHVEEDGESDAYAIDCCRTLEGWLREWGRDAEADQFLAKMDEAIGPDDIDAEAAALPST